MPSEIASPQCDCRIHCCATSSVRYYLCLQNKHRSNTEAPGDSNAVQRLIEESQRRDGNASQAKQRPKEYHSCQADEQSMPSRTRDVEQIQESLKTVPAQSQ